MTPRARNPDSLFSRRTFCVSAAALCASRILHAQDNVHFNVAEYDRARSLAAADLARKRGPTLLTSAPAPVHGLPAGTYYSEDTEWWPVEGAATPAMERRSGSSNPKAFSAHRDLLIGMNGDVGACVAAWRLTGDAAYAQHAMLHLRAWFLDDSTRMQPNLEYAATVPGKSVNTTRGVEDTVMLAETIRAASFLCAYNGVATADEAAGLRRWCHDFATWLNESKRGTIARDAKDRLAICWTLQAAECARFSQMEALSLECSHRFRDRLLRQMNFDGVFELELHRGDPYSSSIFTLECLSATCEVLSTPLERLWDYTLPDGRGMRSAVAFLYPSLDHRPAWRYPADLEHFSDWPLRPSSLLFAGRAFTRPEYIATWKRLSPDPTRQELLRRVAIRQPALWTVRAPA